MSPDNDYLIMCEAEMPGALFVEPLNRIGDEAGAIFRGAHVTRRPVEFIRREGEEEVDFVMTARYGPIILTSAHFIEVLEQASISGWSTYPVAIDGNGLDLRHSYVGFSITGICGPIDNKRSRKVKRRMRDGHEYEMWAGVHPDMRQWDGSDMFSPAGTFWIFVRPKVRTVVEAAGLRNIDFKDPDVARNPAIR
jgi:hypothetical protein